MLNVVCNYDPSLGYQIIRVAESEEDMAGLHHQFAKDILQIRCYIYESNGTKFPLLTASEKRSFREELYKSKDGKCKHCEVKLETKLEFIYNLNILDDSVFKAKKKR